MNQPDNGSDNQPDHEITKNFFCLLLSASANDTDSFKELREMMQQFCDGVKINFLKIIKHKDYSGFIQTYQTHLQKMMGSLKNITTVTTKKEVISDPKKVGDKIQEYEKYLDHIATYYEELQELLDTRNIQSSFGIAMYGKELQELINNKALSDNSINIIYFKKLLNLGLIFLQDKKEIQRDLVLTINLHPGKKLIEDEITEMEAYLKDGEKKEEVINVFNLIATYGGHGYVKGPGLGEVVGREQVKTMIKKIHLLMQIDAGETMDFIHIMTDELKKKGAHTDTDLLDTTKNYYMDLFLDNTDKSLSLYIYYHDGTQWLLSKTYSISKKMSYIYLLIHKLGDIKDDNIITCIEVPSDEDISEQQTLDEEMEMNDEDDRLNYSMNNINAIKKRSDDDDFQNRLSSLSRMYKEYVLIPIILKDEKWTKDINSYELNNLLNEIFDESSFEKDKKAFLNELGSHEKKNSKKGTYTITFYLSNEGQLAIKLSNDNYDGKITIFGVRNDNTINDPIAKKFLEKRGSFTDSLEETLDYDNIIFMENRKNDEENNEDDENYV